MALRLKTLTHESRVTDRPGLALLEERCLAGPICCGLTFHGCEVISGRHASRRLPRVQALAAGQGLRGGLPGSRTCLHCPEEFG